MVIRNPGFLQSLEQSDGSFVSFGNRLMSFVRNCDLTTSYGRRIADLVVLFTQFRLYIHLKKWYDARSILDKVKLVKRLHTGL